MAAEVYTRLEERARLLIEKYGKEATLIKSTKSGPAHNPTVTPDPSTVKMVETGYSLTNRNESLVQVGDKLGLISTAAASPAKGNKIEIDSVKYTILDVEPLNPGGVTLLFEFHARK